MSDQWILNLYQHSETVFTAGMLKLYFPQFSAQSLKNRLTYAVRQDKLINLRRGIYAKPQWNSYEFANKLYTPSYISLETVLQNSGVIFQDYSATIFLISYLTRSVKPHAQTFLYHKLKDSVLLNPTGLIQQSGYTIASVERAWLDTIFIYKDYHFDNLRALDWDMVHQLQTIYQSQALNQRVASYYQLYQQDHAQ